MKWAQPNRHFGRLGYCGPRTFLARQTVWGLVNMTIVMGGPVVERPAAERPSAPRGCGATRQATPRRLTNPPRSGIPHPLFRPVATDGQSRQHLLPRSVPLRHMVWRDTAGDTSRGESRRRAVGAFTHSTSTMLRTHAGLYLSAGQGQLCPRKRARRNVAFPCRPQGSKTWGGRTNGERYRVERGCTDPSCDTASRFHQQTNRIVAGSARAPRGRTTDSATVSR